MNIILLGEAEKSNAIMGALIGYTDVTCVAVPCENISDLALKQGTVVILCDDMQINNDRKNELLRLHSDNIKVVAINNDYLFLIICKHLKKRIDIPLEAQIDIFLPSTVEKYRTILHNILGIEPYTYDAVLDNTLDAYESSYGDIYEVMSKEYKTSIVSLSQAGEVFFSDGHGFDAEVNEQNKAFEFIRPSRVVLASCLRQMGDDITNVHIPHSLILKPIGKEILFNNFMLSDYICLPTKTQFDFVKNLMDINKHKIKKDVCIIPLGYPKLDMLLNDLSKHHKEPDSICYAPTLLTHNQQFVDTLSLANGKVIIEKLLAGSDCNVIFRPHPLILKYEHVGKSYAEDIIATFKDNPRFELDDSKYYLSTFARSKLMISDFSSSMQTFAFSTLRPFVALSSSDFGDVYTATFDGEDIRGKCGVVVQSLDEVSLAVENILNNLASFEAKIKSCRQEEVFNLGTSSTYLRDNFKYISSKTRHKDWLYFKAQ